MNRGSWRIIWLRTESDASPVKNEHGHSARFKHDEARTSDIDDDWCLQHELLPSERDAVFETWRLRLEYDGCICQTQGIKCIVVESESKYRRNSTEEQLPC
jgi:hypothetical protein